MWKKLLCGCVISAIVIFLVMYTFNLKAYLFPSLEYALETSWNIKLERPQKIEYIFSSDGIDGENFYIAYYDSNKMNKMKNMSNLNVLNESSIEQINDFIFQFYDMLSIDNKSKFEEHFDVNKLIIIDSPYLFLSQKDDYRNKILLLFDFDVNKIYILNTTS